MRRGTGRQEGKNSKLTRRRRESRKEAGERGRRGRLVEELESLVGCLASSRGQRRITGEKGATGRREATENEKMRSSS